MNPKYFLRAAAALAVLLALPAAAALPPARPARVLIEANAREGTVCSADGTELHSLAFDRRGQAVTEPLLPGDYMVQAGSLRVRFTLQANAAVCQVEGDGWGDGEILHLGYKTTGSLTVRYRDAWRWTLDGETADEALPSLSDGVCIFAQLPLGSYVLQGDGVSIPILLTQDVPEQTIDLR